MADKKVSAMTPILAGQIDGVNDRIPFVDVSEVAPADRNKSIAPDELVSYIGGSSVYSTTETTIGTYLGVTHYRKVVDTGGLPNATNKLIAHGITGIAFITKVEPVASNGSGGFLPLPRAVVFSGPDPSYLVDVEIIGANIQYNCIQNYSTYTASRVTLEYTKV